MANHFCNLAKKTAETYVDSHQESTLRDPKKKKKFVQRAALFNLFIHDLVRESQRKPKFAEDININAEKGFMKTCGRDGTFQNWMNQF